MTNYRLPAVVFANKMDKQCEPPINCHRFASAATLDKCTESIERILHMQTVPINVPLFTAGDATRRSVIGVVDPVRMTKLTWLSGDETADAARQLARNVRVEVLSASNDAASFELACAAREQLVAVVADLDDEFANVVLGADTVHHADVTNALARAIRTCTLSGALLPIVCGSAARSVGVQPLLDAVVDYLPSPNERQRPFDRYFTDAQQLLALAFKTEHDRRLGRLTYVRVYK